MGCCQSTGIPLSGSTKECEDRRAPPPEEETVKEVLSETPISKPPTPINPNIHANNTRDYPSLVQQQALKNTEPPLYLRKKVAEKEKEEAVLVSEISEASEMCSFSGSFSTTTLTNDKLDDADEVTQQVVGTAHQGHRPPRKRSYSGDFNCSGRERVLRSPARRSTPSPGKRNQMRSSAATIRQAVAPAQGRSTAAAQRRSVGPTASKYGDQRRSRSPAPRVEMSGTGGNVGPNKQTVSRVIGKLGGRLPEIEVEDGEKVEEKPDDDVSGGEISESLENPHVALECFIFL